MRKYLTFFSVFAFTFLAALAACANGLGGQRLEKTVGQYVVDIGTDQEFAPQAGAPIRFDFNLLRSDTRAGVPFTDVDVYITQDGKPLMDSDVAVARSGPTLITFTFPQSGSYKLQTTFYDKDKTIADASFPLAIGGSAAPSASDGNSSGSGRYLVFGILIGAAVGAAGGAAVALRKKNAP